MKIVEITMPASNRTYWHGTNNVRGRIIMQQGLTPGNPLARRKGYIPAAQEAVYLTPSFTYALHFAQWENRQSYGWIFAVDGTKLTRVDIDEDDLGYALQAAYRWREYPNNPSWITNPEYKPAWDLGSQDAAFRSQILAIGDRVVPEDLALQIRQYNRFNPRWLVDAAKLMMPHLSVEMKIKMINAGCQLAHLETIVPDRAWRFPPRQSLRIHNEVTRTGLAVLDQMAERMR